MRSSPLLSASMLIALLFFATTVNGCNKKTDVSRSEIKQAMDSVKSAIGARGGTFQNQHTIQLMKDHAAVLVRKQDVEALDAPPAAQRPVQRKIQYTASMSLITDSLDKAQAELTKLIDDNEGYIARSDLSGSTGDIRAGSWTVRIPAGKFQAFCKAAASLGEVERTSQDSQDVTAEYYDLENHIKNKEAELEGLRELMKQFAIKTDKLKNLLEIRGEMQKVQDELERSKGRLRLLANLTDMTTVTISIRERRAYIPPEAPKAIEVPTFSTRAGKMWSDSVESLTDFVQSIALFGIALAPWLPLILLGAGGVWMIARLSRSRSANHPAIMPAGNGTPPTKTPAADMPGAKTTQASDATKPE